MQLKARAQRLDKYIYPLILFTVAIIPLHQEVAATAVLLTFLGALLARWGGSPQQPRILKKWQQGVLYLLLLLAWVSLHFSQNQFISSCNFVYVVGQYTAMVYLLLHYGWQKPRPFTKRVPGGNWRHQLQNLPRPIQILGVFLLMSLVVSSVGLAQKFLGVTAEGIWVDPQQFPDLKVRVFSTLVNPNILAGYLVLVIAYATAWGTTLREKYVRIGCGLAGVLATWCLLYTYSRGNWLACVALLLAFCLFYSWKALLPVILAGGVGLAVGGAAVWQRLGSILNGQDTSIALRMAYFRSTKWIIEAFPWGVGWYGYRFVYPTYNYYLADESVIMYHCHNIFLNVWAELGIQGLLAFLLVWGMFIYNAVQLSKTSKNPWLLAMGRGYVLASIGIAVGGLTDHVYFNTQMGLLFWTLGILTMLCKKLSTFEA